MAGQSIMQDFVGFRIPLWLRRLVTLVPAAIVVWIGVQPTEALVISQVILSLILPVPMIALLVLIRRPAIMAQFAIGRSMQVLAGAATVLVMILNVILVLQTCGIAPDLFGGN
jgi:manganese transport protein